MRNWIKNIFTNTTPPACKACVGGVWKYINMLATRARPDAAGMLCMQSMPGRHGRRAFTLLETAIVIGILSLVLSGGLAIYRVQFVKERMDTTRERLENIRTALADYKLKNAGKLPCPASLKDTPADPKFGSAVNTTCTGTPTGTGTFRPPNLPPPGNHPVRIGAVPITELGLTMEHMFDSWGRRFVYAVSEEVADTGDENKGGIRLLAPDGIEVLGPKKHQTPFVVLSMGKSGQGGYTQDGKLFGTCGGALEGENCDFANNATFRTRGYADTEDPATRFDDIIVNNLGNLSGFASDAVTVCGNLGKIYGPGAPGADPANGCVDPSAAIPPSAIATCSDKGMLYSPTNPNRDSNSCIYPAIPTNTQFPDADCKTATKNVVRYKGTTLEICNGTTFAAVGGAGGGSSGVIVPKGTACPSGTVATSYNWVSKSCSTAAGNNYNSDACSSTSWSAGSCSTPSGWSGTATTCTYTISYNSSTMPKGRWGCCSAGCSPSYSSSSSQVVCTSVDYTQITCTPK